MNTTWFNTKWLGIVFALGLMTTLASAQTDTTFTYQGLLNENGNPANGPYNMEFSLWDAASGGNQVGNTNVLNGVQVTDGSFTVELDFGAAVFDNSNRWLEIEVNGTLLAPRNLITRVPYAIQTRGIFVDELNNVGIGTVAPRGELEVADFTAGEVATVGVAADDAAGGLAVYSSTFLFPHFADRVSLFSDAFESSGLDLRADGSNSDIRFYTGGFDVPQERMRITAIGNVGIGTAAPSATLAVAGPIRGESDGSHQFPYGIAGYFSGANGKGVMGEATSNTGSVSGVEGYTNSDSGYGVYGANLNVIAGSGVLGFSRGDAGVGVEGNCSETSGFDFFASGAGINYGSSSSRRWKSNIVSIDQPLEKISQLQGVYFDWDAEHGGHHDIGMIAEEVGKVLPEIVQYEDNGVDADGMDYSMLTPLLVEAVKTLRDEKNTEINELKQQNHESQQQIQELQQQNQEMQQRIQELRWLVQRFASIEEDKSK